eukprot:3941371-Rhodomonas_salina.2
MALESNHLPPVGVDDARSRDSDVISDDWSTETSVPPTTPAGCDETHHPGAVNQASLTAGILRPNKRHSAVGGRMRNGALVDRLQQRNLQMWTMPQHGMTAQMN